PALRVRGERQEGWMRRSDLAAGVFEQRRQRIRGTGWIGRDEAAVKAESPDGGGRTRAAVRGVQPVPDVRHALRRQIRAWVELAHVGNDGKDVVLSGELPDRRECRRRCSP